jgi:anti-sigma-K factor RskA
MTAHDWFIGHRLEYATRVLEAGELAQFADHLVRCPECADAVGGIEREFAWLAMGAPPVAPPPGLTRRLATGVLEPRRFRARWVLPGALAAGLSLSVVMTWQSRTAASQFQVERDSTLVELRRSDQLLAAALDTLSLIRSATRVRAARLAIDGGEVGLVILEDPKTHRWTVIVHGLPEAPPGERFALWFVCEKGMREGTELPPTTTGTAVLVLPMPQDLGAVLAASITRETRASAGTPMTKQELLHIEM